VVLYQVLVGSTVGTYLWWMMRDCTLYSTRYPLLRTCEDIMNTVFIMITRC
jgi:hypothetical protein